MELLADIGITLPVRRWQSHILRVQDHHLVDRITTWLDGPRLTLVPYREGGRPVTLIANAGRMSVERLAETHLPVNHEEVELLLQQLVEAFPRLDLRPLTWDVHG